MYTGGVIVEAPAAHVAPSASLPEGPRPTIDGAGIPAELVAKAQWVARDAEKVPIDPGTGLRARPGDPGTCGTYEEAARTVARSGLAGVGYMFNGDETGVDLDNCRDPETGRIEPWAWEIVTELRSYTEVSPSGRGLHILARGSLPAGRRRLGQVEMYDRGRYFTVTGHHLAGTPATIEERSQELAVLHRRTFPERPPAASNGDARPVGSATEPEILDRARRAKYGEKFERLWRGDWSGYQSQSEGDLALCRLLGCAGAHPSQLDALWRASGLAGAPERVQKWDRFIPSWDMTYGEHTIQRALSGNIRP